VQPTRRSLDLTGTSASRIVREQISTRWATRWWPVSRTFRVGAEPRSAERVAWMSSTPHATAARLWALIARSSRLNTTPVKPIDKGGAGASSFRSYEVLISYYLSISMF